MMEELVGTEGELTPESGPVGYQSYESLMVYPHILTFLFLLTVVPGNFRIDAF
jgi:hypothetical protein